MSLPLRYADAPLPTDLAEGLVDDVRALLAVAGHDGRDEGFWDRAEVLVARAGAGALLPAVVALGGSAYEEHQGLARDLLVAVLRSAQGSVPLGTPDRAARVGPVVEEVATALLALTVPRSASSDLRWSLVHALAAVDDPRLLPALLASADDPDVDVRLLVLQADHDLVAAALPLVLRATTDDDPRVRDWATARLSWSDADGEGVRDALAARLADSDDDAAAEAADGLAQRGDPRALPVLLRRLATDDLDGLGWQWVEASAALGDPALLPALRRLREAGWDRGYAAAADAAHAARLLDEALEACAVIRT